MSGYSFLFTSLILFIVIYHQDVIFFVDIYMGERSLCMIYYNRLQFSGHQLLYNNHSLLQPFPYRVCNYLLSAFMHEMYSYIYIFLLNIQKKMYEITYHKKCFDLIR